VQTKGLGVRDRVQDTYSVGYITMSFSADQLSFDLSHLISYFVFCWLLKRGHFARRALE